MGASLHCQGTGDHERVGASLHWIGTCHAQQGEWSEARGWFERAVIEKEQGDVHGRVDHASLGRSLAMLARAHGALGEHGRAAELAERALVAVRRGDIFGRVDEGLVADIEGLLRQQRS